MAVIPTAAKRLRLNFIKAGVSWRLKLFVNAIIPGVNTAWADLVEATFSGYAVPQPVFANAVTLEDGRAAAVSQMLQFTHNGGAVQNLVRGWALSSPVVAEMHALELFPVPKLFAANGDTLAFFLTMTLNQG